MRRRERSEVSAVEVADAGVVLHDQRAARRNVIQQFLVVCGDVFLRVVGANAENDRSVLAQIFAGKFFGRKHGDVHSDLLQHRWNFVSGAQDVATFRSFGTFTSTMLTRCTRRLIVVGAGQIFASHEAVAFAVILSR